jgi:type IV pilus assembly protein PilY1
MKPSQRVAAFALTLLLAAPLLLGHIAARAAGLNLGTTPLYLGASVQPIVMLDLPRDEELFIKAYNDYTDIDGDGIPDTQYKQSIVYYGYFDSYKCYSYDAVNNRFNPASPQRAATATDLYCSDSGVQATTWSGNFLNWVTMSRMDEVRKILYGGLRVVDTNSATVLERAIIPGDVHSWVKYYNGSAANDIGRLTPFSLSNTPRTYAFTASSSSVSSIATTTNMTVSSITQSSGVATATTASAHGLVAGNTFSIANASPSGYNGTFTVLASPAPTATTFSYTVASGLTSPATGGSKTVTSTFLHATATVTTSANHGFSAGQAVVISGVTGTNAALYNGTFVIASAPSGTTFTYVMTGQPTANAPAPSPPGSISASAGLPVRAASSITFSGTTATVNFTAAHGFTNGTSVVISGANPLIYNGTYPISTAGPLSTSFTYTLPSTPTANSTAASVTLSAAITIPITNSGAAHNVLLGDQVQLSAGGTAPTIVITPDNAISGLVTVTGRATTVSSTSITVTPDGSSGGCAGNNSPCSNNIVTNFTVTNLSSHGISICNITMAANAGVIGGGSELLTYNNNNNPPLMRVVAGNYALWATTDATAGTGECRWSATENGSGNGNKGFYSEILANSAAPDQATVGQGTGIAGPVTGITSTGQFAVRVQVCVAGLLGQENCLQYPNGNWKPVGLLQNYASGNNRKIKFGLFTGSYSKNLSGGVLRKNPGYLDTAIVPASPNAADELDVNTGIFQSVNGIIQTLNHLNVFGYDYSTGKYDSSSDGCNSPGLVRVGSPLAGPTFTEGQCSSWGNPLSEIYTESLRYLAGKSANTAFTPTPPAAGVYSNGGLTKDGVLGLNVQGWQDPLSTGNYCAPLNVVVFNASINSYDGDQIQTQLQNATSGFGIDTATLTKNLGIDEGIVNTGSPPPQFMIGDKGNSIVAPTGDGGTCTPKILDQANILGDARGICPEAPALEGSYLMTGAAWWAHLNHIRTDLTVPVGDTRSLKATTYAVSLSGGNPTIKIPVPGTSPTRYVTILPAGRTLNSACGGSGQPACPVLPTTNAYRGTGWITEFKIVRQDLVNGTGKFFVSYDDSLQGNDHDLDAWGYISYKFINSNTQLQVTTQVVYAAAGFSMGFGFVISGTNGSDGVHYLSAHQGNTIFNFTATDGTVECTGCIETDLARSRTFNLSASAASTTLKEPLFFAAKYGGFNDLNGNGVPDQVGEWDVLRSDGSSGSDGLPDNYFLVTNPVALNAAINRTFIYILNVSSASSVATNSTSLNTGSRVYQARFNSNEWSGQLLAFDISTAGVINPTPDWNAGLMMPSATSRVIITYNAGPTPGTPGSPVGIPFEWSSITSAQQKAYLDMDGGSGVLDTPGTLCTANNVPSGCSVQGLLRLNYLRGDQSNEGATAGTYRVRPTTVLADIINSTPRYVGPPSATFSDPNYIVFRSNFSSREPMLYVGSNGGMLHAFDASSSSNGGREKLAYVPYKMYPGLTKLTSKVYSHQYYVDGTPSVSDACLGTCSSPANWKTVLVGGYNAGGQGYYALNVTDPTTWTEGNAASIVMWEFTDANDPDLDFSYSKPVIAKMANGRWAAIFGNGYNNSAALPGETACTGGTGAVGSPYTPAGCTTSVSGQSYLFIVFLDGPTGAGGSWQQGIDYIKIPTGAGSAASPNGLATPQVVDTNGDGLADAVYAGDLLGNLWKFDVSSGTTGSWTVASGGIPLFQATDYAGNPQAITTQPVIYPNPSGGLMVLFGTGKYLEATDDTGPYKANSFYGIWDRLEGTTVAKSTLMQQKVLNVSASNPTGGQVDNGNTFRLTSAYVPNYTENVRTNAVGTFGDADSNPTSVDLNATTQGGQNGWYIDLPNSGNGSPPNALAAGTGEMVAFDPLISTGKLVFTTLLPSTVPCQSGGTSFVMDLDPVTGSRLAFSPFDVNGDASFSNADFVSYGGTTIAVSGLQSTIGIVPQPTVIAAGTGREIKVLSGSSGGLMSVLENAPSNNPTSGTRTGKRISWREILSD